MAFTLWFMGGEQPTWQKLMRDAGVDTLGVSYWGLKRRLPKTKPYLLGERLDGFRLFLDSGGHTANKTPGTTQEWEEYAEAYQRFVAANVDALEMVSEFDCLALGPAWVAERRAWYEEHVPLEKFMPVWHEAYGVNALDQIAGEYERVGIPEDALKNSVGLAVRVNTLAQRFGTGFHAVACARPDELKNVRFASAATSSWLSPTKYGETIVWDGVKLHRYPKRLKDQARRRHRQLFDRAGFDGEAICDDNHDELARFTVWSFKQLEAAVDKRRGPLTVVPDAEVSDTSLSISGPSDATGTETPDTKALETRNATPLAPATKRAPEDVKLLPIIGFDKGEDDRSIARPTDVTLRRCDSCYVSASCPAMQPGAECAFRFPLEVRTKEQLAAFLRSIVEMHGHRVAFARYVEELNGGFPDPNVSQEIDRLFRIVDQLKKIEDTSSFVRMTAEVRAEGGVLSRIFGDKAASLTQLERPIGDEETNRALSNIVDAEVIDS